MVDWTLFIAVFGDNIRHFEFLVPMLIQAVTNWCPNLCQPRNSMQLVLDQPCCE